MPRARTGTLVIDTATGAYKCRITVRHTDGTTTRPWFALDTQDEGTAHRLMRALVKQHEHTPGAPPTRVEPYAMEWLDARRQRGTTGTDSEIGWLKNHILPTIGALFLADVKPLHIRQILDQCVAKGFAQQTLRHIRQTMQHIFAQAWRDDLISENPVEKVLLPQVRQVKKKRAILTDDEIASFFACDLVPIEMRLMVLVARVEGGMRTRDLTAWTWTMIDLPVDDRGGWTWCIVPRTKTGEPQRLEVPEVLRAPLRAWWEKHGRPTSGPVFPTTRGKRKGQARPTRGVTFAERLRHWLLKAGIDRHELHHETEWGLPVDFHSCRRAFATALAEQKVDNRLAMHLTGHSDPSVHERYVMLTRGTEKIPDGAVPRLGIRPGIVSTVAKTALIIGEQCASCVASVSRAVGMKASDGRKNKAVCRMTVPADPHGSSAIVSESSGIVSCAEMVETLRAEGRAVAVLALNWDAIEACVLAEEAEG
jgi:integrase